MPDTMHTCPVAGCERNCSSNFLMCPATRQLVYDTFASGAGLFTDEYREARKQAIDEAVASRTRAAAKTD